jgi:hypothetical protein
MRHKFPKLKKEMETKKCFYVVAFDIIRILTHLAPQNEHQHLSFVKDIHEVGTK